MAAFARSAPLPQASGEDSRSLVASEYYDNVDHSLSITRKIVLSIPEAHRAYITAETMVLDQEKGKFAIVAENIGVPIPPILPVSSENSSSSLEETTLVQMMKGLLLHQTLLSNVSNRLGPQGAMDELLGDTSDLLHHISQLLKTIKGDSAEVPAAPELDLRLSSEFDVQVATHVILQQLQDFGQDMERILRQAAQANEDVTQ